MLSTEAKRPLNRWDHHSIRPGAVGMVGDVLVTPKLKHSCPEMEVRYDSAFSGNHTKRLGSNVTDGQTVNYNTGGGPSRTFDTSWGGRRNFKTQRGWVHQDLRAADRTIQPLLGTTPGYSWHNKIARTYSAMTTGDKFLTLPGGYQPAPGDVSRGGSVPRVVATQNSGEQDYAANPSAGTAFVPPTLAPPIPIVGPGSKQPAAPGAPPPWKPWLKPQPVTPLTPAQDAVAAKKDFWNEDLHAQQVLDQARAEAAAKIKAGYNKDTPAQKAQIDAAIAANKKSGGGGTGAGGWGIPKGLPMKPSPPGKPSQPTVQEHSGNSGWGVHSTGNTNIDNPNSYQEMARDGVGHF